MIAKFKVGERVSFIGKLIGHITMCTLREGKFRYDLEFDLGGFACSICEGKLAHAPQPEE